jgi:hypothetical protein
MLVLITLEVIHRLGAVVSGSVGTFKEFLEIGGAGINFE